jgi:hypothetical protein
VNRTKTISGVRIKDAELGTVTAVFATFDVVDKDGDLTKADAIADGQRVIISAWQHASWQKGGAASLPVGYGTIVNNGKEAILEGQFLMETTHGRDAFLTVKALSDHEVQEWSYSLHNVKQHAEKIDGRSVNVLDSIFVKEVSPVMIGSGNETRTLATKDAGGSPVVLESIAAYIDRRKAWASEISGALRAAANERWGGEDVWVWVRDYDVDSEVLVAEVEDYGDDPSYRLVQVDFTRAEDGTITLGGEETDVRSVTTYAPKAGATFAEHCSAVVTSVQALSNRAAAVITQRTDAGKSKALSADRRADLEQAVAGLQAVLTVTPSPTDRPAKAAIDPGVEEDFLNAAVAYQALKNGALT